MSWGVLLRIVLVLALGLGAAAAWQAEYGYVLVSGGSWVYERSLSQTAVLLAAAFVVLHLALRGAAWLWRAPQRLAAARRARRAERARRNLLRGIIELLEGHWHKAEKILLEDVEASDTPLLNYLLAARAAQQQEAYARRDEYLRRAHNSTPGADIAVGLSQAELQLQQGQVEPALATLNRLRELAPHHPYVLKLLARLYAQLDEWENLAELLPELRRRGIFPEARLAELERRCHTALLRYAARARQVHDVLTQWRLLPRAWRRDPGLFGVFIDCLLESGQAAVAERQLRAFLNRHWDEALVERYGRIETADPAAQLARAESWAKDHGRSPMLLLTLARLCRRLRLWGKARAYYEASLAAGPTPEACFELAELLEALGETQNAQRCLRRGLEAVLEGRVAALPLPGEGPPLNARDA